MALSKLIKIGSDEQNDLVFREPGVEAFHAEVYLDFNKNAYLTDLGSRSGTFVNGQRITSTVILTAGDRVRLGDRRELNLETLTGKTVESKTISKGASPRITTSNSFRENINLQLLLIYAGIALLFGVLVVIV